MEKQATVLAEGISTDSLFKQAKRKAIASLVLSVATFLLYLIWETYALIAALMLLDADIWLFTLFLMSIVIFPFLYAIAHDLSATAERKIKKFTVEDKEMTKRLLKCSQTLAFVLCGFTVFFSFLFLLAGAC